MDFADLMHAARLTIQTSLEAHECLARLLDDAKALRSSGGGGFSSSWRPAAARSSRAMRSSSP